MKKIIVFLILVCINFSLGFSQNSWFNFEYIGSSNPIPCDPFYTDPYPNGFQYNWKQSHGTPTCGDLNNQNTYSDGRFYSSYFNGDLKSEGLFIPYSFMANTEYTVQFSVTKIPGDDAVIYIAAANGLTQKQTGNCIAEAFPSNIDKELIVEQIIETNLGNYVSYTITYTPTKAFSQLWVCSTQKYIGKEGTFFINNISISDNDHTPPWAPDNFTAVDVTDTGFKLTWDQSYDPDGDLNHYEIYKKWFLFWVYEATSTKKETSKTFTGKESCEEYKYRITAHDDLGYISAPSYVTVKTKKTLPDNVVLNLNYTSLQEVRIKAKESIQMTNGFVFKALENNYYFITEFKDFDECPDKSDKEITSNYNETHINLDEEEGYKISENITNIEEINNYSVIHQIQIFPNPVSDKLYINNLNNYIGGNVQITDILGKIQVQEFILSDNINLSLSNLNNGIYFININNDQGNTIIQKIIKQ